MNIDQIFTQIFNMPFSTGTVTPVNMNRTYNILNHATNLSNYWKDRAAKLSAELDEVFTDQENLLQRIDDEDKIKEILETIDFCNNNKPILNAIANNKYPLSQKDVQTVLDVEGQLYKNIMSEKVRNRLVEEMEENETFNRRINEIAEQIDKMWYDNLPEEDIKKYIQDVLKTIYKRKTNDKIKQIANNIFTSYTARKPVRVCLSEEQIKKLKREKNVCEDTCPTCLDDFNDSEVIILPCKHKFHPDCLIPWVKRSVFCPKCKADIRTSV